MSITATLNFPVMPYPLSAVIASLTREDTGGSVTGMITGSGSAWVLSIDEPQIGLIYNYTITFTFSAGTSNASGRVVGTQANPVGYYTNYNNLVLKFGAKNIAMWSNTNNDDTLPNFGNIQFGLSTTDSQINTFYTNGPYNVPLSPISFMIQDWANNLSVYWTYTCRGLLESDEEGSKLRVLYAQSMSQMALYRGTTSVLSLGASRRWPSPTAAVNARRFR